MNIEKSFNEFYNKFLSENKENFNQIEEQRRKAVHERKTNKILIYIVEIILVIIIICFFKLFGTGNNGEETTKTIFMGCFFVSFAFPMFVALKKRKGLREYEKTYKEKITKNLIKSFCPSLEYYPNGKIEYNDFKNINTTHCNSFYSSNLIRGIYKYDAITIAKVITQYSYHDYSSGGNGYGNYETFDGLFARIELPQKANTELYIKRKEKISEKLFNVFVGDISQVAKSKEAEKFLESKYNKMEVDELNEIFNIYSSSIDCDKNILDSEMNKILIDIYNMEQFEISIKDNYIYMKFWIAGLFSNPPLEKETYDKEIIFKNYKMLYIIFYLLEKLKEKI